MKIGYEIDYRFMCLGSETQGARESKTQIVCEACGEIIPTPFEIFNLVPVHEFPHDEDLDNDLHRLG